LESFQKKDCLYCYVLLDGYPFISESSQELFSEMSTSQVSVVGFRVPAVTLCSTNWTGGWTSPRCDDLSTGSRMPVVENKPPSD